MNKKRAVFNWSGGKDSAHALWKVLTAGEYDVVALLTTINKETGLSTMHDIPLELLEEQSKSIGIPLVTLELRPNGGMADYKDAMDRMVNRFKKEGIVHFIFGDIFLHDVRKHREEHLAPLGIEVVEPLWGLSGDEVMESYLNAGFKAVVVTTMKDGLGKRAIGRTLDSAFIQDLPAGCDLNGENGEYHTLCYDGPIFAYPIPFSLGEAQEESYNVRLDTGVIKTYTYCFSSCKLKK